MFFYCVSLHIQITMARPKYVDTISYTQTWSPMPRHQYWLPLYPLRILTAKPRDEDSADLQHMIHERAASGEPQRCWRDRCRGHWKAPRMRHCGECGECRFFFDHHCLWVCCNPLTVQFNNDITAPHTLVPFLLLVSLTPCLFVLACWPLLPLAWHHIVLLWEHSTSHPWIVQHFWDKKWTWVLGPIHRPLLGLYLGMFLFYLHSLSVSTILLGSALFVRHNSTSTYVPTPFLHNVGRLSCPYYFGFSHHDNSSPYSWATYSRGRTNKILEKMEPARLSSLYGEERICTTCVSILGSPQTMHHIPPY